MGEQRSHVALTAFGCALLGAAWLVPVADRSTAGDRRLPPGLGRRAARDSTRSATCSQAAARQSAGAGRGAVIGLVNLSWGVAAVIGPLAASAAHGHIDERIPFAVIAALCLAVATLMLTGSGRVSAPRLIRRRSRVRGSPLEPRA